jgi:hypothetical protein
VEELVMAKKGKKKKDKKKDKGVLARTRDSVAAAVADPAATLSAAANAATGGSAVVGALELTALGAGVLALLAAKDGGKGSDEESPLLRRIKEIVDERVLQLSGSGQAGKKAGPARKRTAAKARSRTTTKAAASPETA